MWVMLQEQQLCPGVGGRRCGAFMFPLFRDPHPTCLRICSADVTCDICKDWSVVQWEAFLKKCSYSGCRKSSPSGSELSAVLSDSSSLRLGFFASWAPSASPLSTPSSVKGAWPFGGVRGRLSPLQPFGGRGGCCKGFGFWECG